MNITKKFRPTKFSEVRGQATAVSNITSALKSKIIPPAYLFSGLQGSGKTTCARLLAMSLNCQKKDDIEPCGECLECRAILEDNSNYLLELDGARSGKVDDIRELMGTIAYVVPDGNYKVIVIDECHALTKQAWQAALKTIEEPPKNILFIFCTTEIQKVIATIKSRCVHMQFPGVSDKVITNMIQEICSSENVEIEDEAVQLITKNAFGSLRDAQSILEGFIRSGNITTEQIKTIYQTVDPNTVMTYFNSVLEGNINNASNMTKGWMRLGVGPEQILTALLEHLRNMVMDFKIKDANLKKLLKSQKEKIGNNIAPWIEFFYDQLKFIKEYPMEYSLTIDLITIKLIASVNNFKTQTRTKKSKKEPKMESKTEPKEIQNAPQSLDHTKVYAFKDVCKGSIAQSDRYFSRVTIKNNKGTLIDLVTDPSLVVNTYYILSCDLDKAIQGYPEVMNSIVNINTGVNND
jgi:DNA polymerase III subunit gamma/tau